MNELTDILTFKGTVSVISRDLPFKDDDARLLI